MFIQEPDTFNYCLGDLVNLSTPSIIDPNRCADLSQIQVADTAWDLEFSARVISSLSPSSWNVGGAYAGVSDCESGWGLRFDEESIHLFASADATAASAFGLTLMRIGVDT